MFVKHERPTSADSSPEVPHANAWRTSTSSSTHSPRLNEAVQWRDKTVHGCVRVNLRNASLHDATPFKFVCLMLPVLLFAVASLCVWSTSRLSLSPFIFGVRNVHTQAPLWALQTDRSRHCLFRLLGRLDQNVPPNTYFVCGPAAARWL